MKILNKFKSYSFGIIMWFPIIFLFFALIKAPKSLFTDISSLLSYVNDYMNLLLPSNPLYNIFVDLFALLGITSKPILISLVSYTLSWALLIHIVKLVYDLLDIFFHYLESLVERGL